MDHLKQVKWIKAPKIFIYTKDKEWNKARLYVMKDRMPKTIGLGKAIKSL